MNCGLKNSHFEALAAAMGQGGLSLLEELTLANNAELTGDVMKFMTIMTLKGTEVHQTVVYVY